MYKILIFFLLLPINLGAGEIQIDKNYRDKIVSGIFIIEGGNKTKYLYGIKSVKTTNPKRVCEVTVENNYVRWQKAGKTNDFINFLGNRYAPISDKDDKGKLNQFWIKNLQKYLKNN